MRIGNRKYRFLENKEGIKKMQQCKERRANARKKEGEIGPNKRLRGKKRKTERSINFTNS
jgi:hypothetical protein